MSWTLSEDGSRRGGQPVTSQDLEERINMYISAMDKATSVNDEGMSAQLQRDIQHLVDLMEKVSSGETVIDTEVPPPLVMTPIHDAVANPLGELSSRLSDYHKALYFAEEELSENRLEKIQTLQKGLQTIHMLQKRAQAGFPIKEDEIPAPVTIPDDSEFDNDALNTINTRLEQYKSALSFCEKATGEDRRRIPKLQSAIRKLNFLLTRAQVKRPIWQRDIPQEFDYFCVQNPEMKAKSENVAKLTLQARALQHRVSQCSNPKLQDTKDTIKEGLDKLIAKWTESKVVSVEDSANLAAFTAMLDNIEKSGDTTAKAQSATASSEEDKMSGNGEEKAKTDLELIDLRIKEYKTAALKAKREDNVNQAIKDLKVVKGLQPMREALEKGEKVDMTLVPPPPQNAATAGESPPNFASVAESTNKTAPETAPQSAHAQVSPYNIKPSTETAEDKLARKLTSFLEDEGEMKSFTSASSSSPSSLESDLSPLHRLADGNEKVKALAEMEKELMSDKKGCIALASNADPSPAGHAVSKSDSKQSEDHVPSDSNIPGSGNAGNLSSDIEEKSTSGSNALPIEAELDGEVKKEDATPLVSGTGDEKNDSNKETESKPEESGVNPDSEETPTTNTEGSRDSPVSPVKVPESKNPLDRIGFLACQDVHISNVGQNVETVSSSSNVANETIVTKCIDSDLKEQPQNDKDSSTVPASDSIVASVINEKDPASHSLHSLKSESGMPVQDTQNSTLPYSINDQPVNTKNDIGEQSIKNNFPSINDTQKDDNISIATQPNVRNFYKLSGDSINLDDASDMQEFQELMDSMSINNEIPSLTNGGITGLDWAVPSIADDRLNSASYDNNSSTIPETTSLSSGKINQIANHAMNLNSTVRESSPHSSLQKNMNPQLNAQPFSSLNTLTDLGTSLSQVSYEQELAMENDCSTSYSAPSKQNVPLTGLETLKYDLQLAQSKTSSNAKKEVEQLHEQMEKIKCHLRQGGRKDWEEYKLCLERELKALNDGVKDYGERQEWDTYKYLNNKRMLNERELCYLQKHIQEVKE